MKKMKYFAALLISGLMGIQNVSAQLAGSNMFTQKTVGIPDYKKNNFGIELGLGGWNNIDGTEIDLGVRYMYKINPYLGIDAIGIKAMTTTDFDDALIQFMTGIRAFTPEFSKMSLYINLRCGYGGYADSFDGGFCYEAGCGINFFKKYYIGYAFDGNDIYGRLLKCNSFRLGIYF